MFEVREFDGERWMINFACKKFDFGEVVRCSLGLTKTEFKIMEYLVKDSSEEFTSLEVSKIFKIGLSTSQKAIKKLYSGGLLMRSQRNFGSGGYIFVYSINRKH